MDTKKTNNNVVWKGVANASISTSTPTSQEAACDQQERRQKQTYCQIPPTLLTPHPVHQQISTSPPLLVVERDCLGEQDPRVLSAPCFPVALNSERSTTRPPFMLRQKPSQH